MCWEGSSSSELAALGPAPSDFWGGQISYPFKINERASQRRGHFNLQRNNAGKRFALRFVFPGFSPWRGAESGPGEAELTAKAENEHGVQSRALSFALPKASSCAFGGVGPYETSPFAARRGWGWAAPSAAGDPLFAAKEEPGAPRAALRCRTVAAAEGVLVSGQVQLKKCNGKQQKKKNHQPRGLNEPQEPRG